VYVLQATKFDYEIRSEVFAQHEVFADKLELPQNPVRAEFLRETRILLGNSRQNMFPAHRQAQSLQAALFAEYRVSADALQRLSGRIDDQ